MQLRFNDKLVEAQTTDDVLQMVSTKLWVLQIGIFYFRYRKNW